MVAINYTGFTTRSEFTYDGLSRMVKIVEKTGATINSTRKFVWHGQEKLEFRDAADAVAIRIFPQGQHNGTTPYFFTRDHLGSVREVLSGGGTVVARYDYDPFGRSATILSTTPTDMNYTGLYRHSKSNLDLAVFRAYDPDLGRWLNRDPIEERGGLNLYDYVRNNPVLFKDLDGRQGVLAVPGAIGVGAGAATLACYLYPPCREAMQAWAREVCRPRPREACELVDQKFLGPGFGWVCTYKCPSGARPKLVGVEKCPIVLFH